MDWILTAVGILGFWLAGRMVWWAWYVNIANQALWAAYALLTEQYGFLIGTAFYLCVFVQNAIKWTKKHREQEAAVKAGHGAYIDGQYFDLNTTAYDKEL